MTDPGSDVIRKQRPPPLGATLALAPTLIMPAMAFYVTRGWTVVMSFTPDQAAAGQWIRRNQPVRTPVRRAALGHGLQQNVRPWRAVIAASLILALLRSVALVRNVAQEDTIPSILHCPFALSFIIAGLAWHRLLNPTFGIVGTPPMNLLGGALGVRSDQVSASFGDCTLDVLHYAFARCPAGGASVIIGRRPEAVSLAIHAVKAPWSTPDVQPDPYGAFAVWNPHLDAKRVRKALRPSCSGSRPEAARAAGFVPCPCQTFVVRSCHRPASLTQKTLDGQAVRPALQTGPHPRSGRPVAACAGHRPVGGLGASSNHDQTARVAYLYRALGPVVPSGHDRLRCDFDGMAKIAHSLGIQTLILWGLPDDETPAAQGGWSAVGEDLRLLARSFSATSLRFAFHNRDWELQRFEDGQSGLDHLFAGAGGARLFWHAEFGQGALPWQRWWSAVEQIGVDLFVPEYDEPSGPARFPTRSTASARRLDTIVWKTMPMNVQLPSVGTATVIDRGLEEWHPNPTFFCTTGGGPNRRMGDGSGVAVCRGIGLAEMALKVGDGTGFRTAGQLALHVLEAMVAI